MTRIARIRRLVRRDETGVTLVELMIVMVILGAIMGIATTAMITSTRTMGNNSQRLSEVSQTKVAVEGMSRVLRTAIMPSLLNGTCTDCPAFITGDGRTVQFYANIDNTPPPSSGYTQSGPRKVTYTATTGGVLTETVQLPNSHLVTDYNYQYCTPGTGCPVRTRTLARNIPSAATLFTYYDKAGATIATPLQSSTSRLSAVDSIDIMLPVQISNRVETSTVTTRVTLPNADSIEQLQDET